MENLHLMPATRSIRAFILAFLSLFLLIGVPSTLALDVFDNATDGSDSAQGDIQDSDCAELDESLAGSLGCDTSDEVVDFTDFSGELEGPDATGYDEALTENRDAREFIQTIVNYALSFLGLIATVIIIYGGILYVMSRGEEEMASKGKKTITYAAIGIVIVLASFPIVNTLIEAGGGDTGESGVGTNTDGTTITEAGASFDVEAVLDEIEGISQEYLEVYDQFIEVSQQVDYLIALEIPKVVTITEGDYTLSGAVEAVEGWLSGTDDSYRDTYELIDEDDIEDYLSELRTGVQKIQTQVDTYSETFEQAQTLYDYLRSGGQSSYHYKDELKDLKNQVLPKAAAEGDTSDTGYTCPPPLDVPVDAKYKEFDSILTPGVTVYNTDVSLIDDNVCDLIGNIQIAASKDYEEQVQTLIDRLEDLQALFDTTGTEAGSDLFEVQVALKDASSTLTAAQSTITANTVRDILAAMDTLYRLVKNIEFVRVRLSASAIGGNAPLIVRFNILGTEDPSGQTVQDDQIEWDLNGDGVFEPQGSNLSGGVSAEDIAGDAVSATFNEPGTYRVRVRVVSSNTNIAAGVSTVSIEVEPPKSKIVLSMSTGSGESVTIADFRAYPYVNENEVYVTLTEAQNAITFNAQETEDGDGNTGAAGGIISYEWDFGDGDTEIGNFETAGQVSHNYFTEDIYNVSLTVTDDTGITDSKFFKLYVSSVAARIKVSPSTSGPAGTTFTFDGSGSVNELGTITSYQWSATVNGQSFPLENDTGSAINATFENPGLYTITLQVTDNTGNSNTMSVDILVESTPPVATFEYSIPESNQPATYSFDASDSYDPDEGDTLTFEWDFDGVVGEELQILEANQENNELTIQFLEPGEYDVVLTVYDQHEGDLKKTDTAQSNLNIESVLDVSLEIENETARHLNQDGEVDVQFTATSATATAFEIDFGDGETAFTETLVRGTAIFTHTYEEAGIFTATLSAVDDENHQISTTERVYIGSGDAPIAVISIGADNQDIGGEDNLHGTIKTVFTFDASESVNVNGSDEALDYSWNFGDGVTSSQKTVTHVFNETTTYTITLTVRDEDETAVQDEATVQITIEDIKPEIRNLGISPQGNTLQTPLKVNVSVDAVDEDGQISYVKGWYYDLRDTATELGTILAQSTDFTLTINTKGETGETVEYGFAVEVTDNDDNTVSSFDNLNPDDIPTLEVTNGPNDTPVAGFTVDKTSVYIGEEVNFSSTAYDPDGEILYYWWDLEGDGFYNNDPQETPSLSYIFTQIHSEGVKVQLKVEDNAGATANSEPVTIYVDALSDPPDAAFLTEVSGITVTFRNNSKVDEENGALLKEVYWDFNTTEDSNGNGVPDDDTDSTEENPSTTYASLGSYEVKMTVLDSTGQSDVLIQKVSVLQTEDPVAAFTYEVNDKSVEFSNQSTIDTDNELEIRTQQWDFDLNEDSDGDGDPENDVDSTSKNPTHDYPEYDSYDVKLSIEDTAGKTDTIVDSIELKNPLQTVTALLSSVPEANSLKQIILEDDGDEITFFYGAEGGSGKFSYEIDKNIFYDSDGDGIRYNDNDHDDDSSGTWKTPFYISYGHIVVKLTVTDEETGDSDIAALQVIFEGSLLGANLFNATPAEMTLLILSAVLAVVVGISLSFRYRPLRRL